MLRRFGGLLREWPVGVVLREMMQPGAPNRFETAPKCSRRRMERGVHAASTYDSAKSLEGQLPGPR